MCTHGLCTIHEVIASLNCWGCVIHPSGLYVYSLRDGTNTTSNVNHLFYVALRVIEILGMPDYSRGHQTFDFRFLCHHREFKCVNPRSLRE